MIDATVLVPTHRHAALVPYAVRSALDQAGVTVEVFVVADGVESDTHAELEPLLADERVRLLDFPKGERHGELHRHAALREASGRIVCYLSDDDLLLPGHVAAMSALLEQADFAHGPASWLDPDGRLHFFPWNLSRHEFVETARHRRASIGLTGSAHTLEAYRRLPHGWRTAPAGCPTDHWMWLQWLELPGFRASMAPTLTHLWFPDPLWVKLPEGERAAALADWLRRSREPGFEDELDRMLRGAIARAAEDYHLWARREQLALADLRATRTWRLRERALGFRTLRALLARRSGAR